MKKIKIHGKDYVMVKDRIIFFNENYPNGCIQTKLIDRIDGTDYPNIVIFEATVIPDVDKPERFFTGHAEEEIGSSQINKTSALENCETSAIGRALGCMGIGVEDSFASANEVQNAIHQQQNSFYVKTDNHLEMFDVLLKDSYFDGKRSDVKDKWKMINTLSETELFLSQMQQRIKSNGEVEHENN